MNRAFRLVCSVLGFAAAAFLPVGVAVSDACIEDWSTAAPVVKEEGLATVEAVTSLAAARVKGDIVKVTLCREGTRYVYRLVVRGQGGRHTKLTVDAKEPFRR